MDRRADVIGLRADGSNGVRIAFEDMSPEGPGSFSGHPFDGFEPDLRAENCAGRPRRWPRIRCLKAIRRSIAGPSPTRSATPEPPNGP